MLLEQLFPGINLDERQQSLNKSGAPYGIHFGRLSAVSNSRLALEAGEFARDHGKYSLFHSIVFRAYFEEAKNIGLMETVLDLGVQAGMEETELKSALQERRYSNRITEARLEADENRITAVPCFLFENKEKIVGAQSLVVFRRKIENLIESGI